MTSGSTDSQRGSIWRRWDPHVHLPGTLLNDQYGAVSLEEALETLATREPAIEVVGVTDYWTTASFRRAKEAWQQGTGSRISALFPNVELRLDVPTTKGAGVNLHLLCPPDEVDALDRFLGALEFSWRDSIYRADHAGLIALGRDLSGNSTLEEEAALRVGAGQFKVNFDSLRKQFRSDAWAAKNCLVAVSGGQSDGTSGLRTGDGAFAARRQAIERFANIIFSSTPQQSAFWRGEGADSLERLTALYGGPKLCLHGSDAHGLEALGAPDLGRRTWLKGNASFDTLLMACLAPASRSHIGPRSPMADLEHGRIAGISIRCPNRFLPDQLPINSGLVAVIGGRGSGKTALVDLLAAGAGSHQPFENRASFIHRAGSLLNRCVVDLHWTHGEATSHSFAHGSTAGYEHSRGVRYLSQQFVEQLCAADGVSDALLDEIERVVFNAWPVEQRKGAASFRELLAIRLESAHARQQAEVDSITELGEAVTEQRLVKDGLARQQAELAKSQDAVEKLQTQIKGLTGRANLGSAERLADVSEALELRQQHAQALDRRITTIKALRAEVELAQRSRFPRYTSGLRDKYLLAGLDDAQWSQFTADFVGDVDTTLTRALDEAEAGHGAIVGVEAHRDEDERTLDGLDVSQLRSRSIAELAAERQRLEHLVGLDAQRTKRLAQLNEQLATLRSRIAKLNEAISYAAGADARIAELNTQRLSSYAAYFDALLEEEQELNSLYEPLGSMIAGFGSSVAKLRFSVRRAVDVEHWAAAGEELLDLRTAGVFRGIGELARIAAAELLPAWLTGNGREVAEALRAFSVKYSSDLRRQSRVAPSDLDAYRAWERAVSRWLYTAEHVRLSYSLEYDGLSIERLSPGSRGIVLLLLYLAVDQEETDPLIIDQPEENLDPESVYSELVDLFRSASRRRQIIMVTHNSNLVVNTDVDQVIVAHCGAVEEGKLPEISYTMGGLENPHIRKAVCEVLEGGAQAFLERARRLGLHLPELPSR